MRSNYGYLIMGIGIAMYVGLKLSDIRELKNTTEVLKSRIVEIQSQLDHKNTKDC
ncbi:hypothetical protein UFOVP270_51 [uncultured Caudovirales phage]|uniref:Uncharacterized protein n=1 Tax=uncultured Caudovirales phage TaxID=2100421 RepID=A0A6J5LII5_9CAUD|nr:hypothetical protein UFOVP101_6 [uncultured Caudovirales phage]CAB4134384.1 hypothetical protein UFOVP270_51 [uncultured Caudovirales phage]